jgi:hypothetical protein
VFISYLLFCYTIHSMEYPHPTIPAELAAANTRYIELARRDGSEPRLDSIADPETLETSLTPESVETTTRYFADPSRYEDWTNLLGEINTDSPEGQGLYNATARNVQGVQLVRAQLVGDLDQIQELETALYGDLYSDRLFTDAIYEVLDHMATFTQAEYPYTHMLAQRTGPVLEEIVKGRERDPGAKTRLTPEAKSAIAAWLDGKLGHIFEGIDPVKQHNPSEVVGEMQRGIVLLPELFARTRWHARLAESKHPVPRTLSLEECVEIPSGLPPASRVDVMRYGIHELFGHAGRSTRGQSYGSALATYGTATNFKFEETFCSLLESTPFPDGRRGLLGSMSYVGVSLALGALGTDFDRHQLFSIRRDIQHTSAASVRGRDLTPSEVENRRSTDVNIILARIFTAIPLEVKGMAHMPPLTYYFGARQVAPLLNAIGELNIAGEGMDWLMGGKFNPYHPDDRAFMNRYHPMPRALEPFFAEAED